jgi:hypothetical protein
MPKSGGVQYKGTFPAPPTHVETLTRATKRDGLSMAIADGQAAVSWNTPFGRTTDMGGIAINPNNSTRQTHLSSN